MSYSRELRDKVLKKMMPPNDKSLQEISAEEGIPVSTLYIWRTKARQSGGLDIQR